MGLIAAVSIAPPLSAIGQQAHIEVDASRVMNKIDAKIFGSCIEDVNHEVYGGLYDQRLYGESFEEPVPLMHFEGWKAYGGNWSPSGETISVNSGPGYKLVRENPVFENGSVAVDIKVADGSVGGLLLRVSDAHQGADNFDGYEVGINLITQQIILGKHMHNWHPLASAGFNFHANKWVHVKVVMKGPRLQIFANGQNAPLIDFTDQLNILPAGKIALRTYNAHAAFRRLVIHTNGKTITGNFVASRPSPQVSGVWDAIDTDNKGVFRLDNTTAYNGMQSQVIERTGNGGETGVANMGLNHWGVAVRKDQAFEGWVYLRSDAFKGPVIVALQSANGDKTYAKYEITGIGPRWRKFGFHLRSGISDPKARFALYIQDPARLWVDQAVLMSAGKDQFKGLPIRADIAKMMQHEGLTFLRYGGSMVNAPDYRWKNMTGDPDQRPPYKGTWYPYSSNGFGIEDFLKFCEAAGFEAAFAINIEESPKEASDMVQYLTGDTSTIEGKLRAENGHLLPYKVKYIEIGNEEVIHADDPVLYDHYINRFNLLFKAIHSADPAIQLINAAWWRPQSSNMKRVFTALDGKAAYWDLHVDADSPDAGKLVDSTLSQMQRLFLKWNPRTNMKCTIFEENGGLHDMQRALGHASILNAVCRHGDFVLTSCAANALQPFGQNDNGWDQGQIFFTPSQVWGMPPFYAQQMAAGNYEPIRVFDHADGGLDVIAARSGDRQSLVVYIVNPTAEQKPTSILIKHFEGRAPMMHVLSLSGPLSAVNTPTHPRKIESHQKTIGITSDHIHYTFPAYSYTILSLRR